jgi:TPR repeat protein
MSFCQGAALVLLLCVTVVWAQPGAPPQSKSIDPSLLAKAKSGDADAEFRIAISYAKLGNLKESHRWHLMAAQNGNVRAMAILAADYQLGRNVPQDYDQALKWYGKSADKGYSAAMVNLGSMYARGLGVPPDLSQAAAWYLKAAELGDATAQFNIGIA